MQPDARTSKARSAPAARPGLLSISHRADLRFSYGGPVYRKGIQSLLRALYPELPHEELYFEGQSPWRRSAPAKAISLLRSLISPLPAKACHFSSRRFARRLARRLAARRFSAVLITGIDMLWCADLLPTAGCCRIYIAHNVEHELYAAQTEKLRRLPVIGSWTQRDLDKLRRYELAGMAKMDRIITISTEDEARFRRLLPHSVLCTIPPVFGCQPARTCPRPLSSAAPIRIAFLANLEWWPNQEAIAWFLTKVWRRLDTAARQRLELHLYGAGSKRLHEPVNGVHGHGFLPDLTPVWRQNHIMVQPIVCGGGVNIKVAEALHHRMPTLATPLALRGLPVIDDPALVVLEDAVAWREFLAGEGVARLAGRIVRLENARLFDPTHNQERLGQFLAGCLEPDLPSQTSSRDT